MTSRTLVRLCRLDRLTRRAGVDDRAVAVAFSARFIDELLSGAWTVLMPTFRRVFGLSLFQLGLLVQVLEWVALVVEPLAASSIDHSPRRRLLVGGAVVLALSTATMALSPGFAVLLVGFALYGVGSGPLAHTADVVVLESYPADPERAYSRATVLDTSGALLGPAAIAAALFAGVSWRIVLLVMAVVVAGYAWVGSRASFPPPPRVRAEGQSVLGAFVEGVRAAVRHVEIRRSLLVLFAFDVFEVAFVFEYVWLHDEVGLSEPTVTLFAVLDQVVGIVALLALDRWLSARSPQLILRTAAVALVVLPIAWVAVPGIWPRVALGVPLAFAGALVWPLAKARSLTVSPELAGASQAVTTLYPIVPLILVQTWLASTIGIGPAMALTASIGAALVLALSLRTEEPAAATSGDPA